MPAIVVSDFVANQLRVLLSVDGSPDDVAVLQSLRHQIDNPPQPRLKEAHYEPAGTILTHDVLVMLSRWASNRPDRKDFRLHSLLHNCQVAVPVVPKPERSPALIEALKRIEVAQQEKEYNAMLPMQEDYSRNPMLESFRQLSATGSSSRSRIPGQGPTSEEQEWLEVRQQLSAIVNILISMAAVATSVWWAGGTADPIWKTLVAMPLCILVAVAEVVLYARYWRNVRERKERGKAKRRG